MDDLGGKPTIFGNNNLKLATMKSLTSFNKKEQHLENCVHVSFIAMLEDFVFLVETQIGGDF